MKNIEQYKQRFFNLMESELGNVKPLISEQLDYWGMAKDLLFWLESFKTSKGKDNVASILNNIESKAGWDEIQRTYGKPNGKDLITALKEYLGADYSRIVDPLMKRIEEHG